MDATGLVTGFGLGFLICFIILKWLISTSTVVQLNDAPDDLKHGSWCWRQTSEGYVLRRQT